MVNTLSSSGQGPMAVPACISIGILAWNEEEAIGLTLASLFRQSLFAHLERLQLRCEIVCVANGCTDRTPAVAQEVFEKEAASHPFKTAFTCRSLNVSQRGK